MPNPELDKLPSLLQMAGWFGAAFGGFVAYLFGVRRSRQPQSDVPAVVTIDPRDAELIESRALEKVRLVITAGFESLRIEMNAFENRHRETHQEIFERLREIERHQNVPRGGR